MILSVCLGKLGNLHEVTFVLDDLEHCVGRYAAIKNEYRHKSVVCYSKKCTLKEICQKVLNERTEATELWSAS